jgi:hypothetical protein
MIKTSSNTTADSANATPPGADPAVRLTHSLGDVPTALSA